MLLLQKDLEIKKIYNQGTYDYQLTIQGEPVLPAVHSDNSYDFGLVNVTDSIHMELYRNHDSMPETDFNDPDTFVITIK